MFFNGAECFLSKQALWPPDVYSSTSPYLQIADRSAVTCDPATFSCFMLQHFLSRLLRQGKKSFCLEQGGLRFWHQNLKKK